MVAYRGAYFGTNDTLNEVNPFAQQRDLTGLVSKFGAAQTAALCALLAGYPFGTVRLRLQLQADTPVTERKYKGSLHCMREIAKTEGVSAL